MKKIVLLFVILFISTSAFFVLLLREQTHSTSHVSTKITHFSILNLIDTLLKNEKEHLTDTLTTRIKDEVYEAHAVAEELAKRVPREKLREFVVESIRDMRYNEGRGYFFMTTLDGLEILFADKPELENRNLWDMQDTEGKYVIREMAETVQRYGEGFTTYKWTRPNALGDHYEKLSFVKLFEPLNCFIGTGEYLADTEDQLKEKLINFTNNLNNSTFGIHILIVDKNNTIIASSQKEYLNIPTKELKDDFNIPWIESLLLDLENSDMAVSEINLNHKLVHAQAQPINEFEWSIVIFSQAESNFVPSIATIMGAIFLCLVFMYVSVYITRLFRQSKQIAIKAVGESSNKKAPAAMKAVHSVDEAVVKELKHAVKNNFQQLISLQQLRNKPLFHSLYIWALTSVYNEVKHDEQHWTVAANKSLATLLGAIEDQYQETEIDSGIMIDFDSEELELQLNTAIGLSFFIIEAVSNIYEHCPPNSRASIQLHKTENNRLSLSCRDNGPGIHLEELEKSGKGGFQFMNLMAAQLNGQLLISKDNGTHIQLTFPV